MPLIKIKRVYDRPLRSDGYRVLIDRLWPRGLKKEDAKLDEWAKELAPTDRLRNWFDHDPYYWQQFKRKYQMELNQNKMVEVFMETYKQRKVITLLYATTYDKLTHAIVIKEYLENHYCAI
ncbi:MAG TPA: DUF488 family protein [Flavisolibacter sp.]|jgi:uncharacterized protein YeaO (DUF488 family)|nr:DUF488 family protein [Flavisolibacter sp.]